MQAQSLQEESNCPHYWDGYKSGNHPDTISPISGRILNLPEYHDCQRLVERAGTQYGPLVALFAASYLERLSDTLLAEMTTRSTAVGIAAATLLPLDGPFLELGVDLSSEYLSACLYMWHTDKWYARMVPVADHGQACMRPLDISSNVGMAMQVDTTTDAGIGGIPHPPAARFERSSTGSYIGIRCGDKWCSVGRPGFRRADPIAPDTVGLDTWLGTLPGDRATYPVTAANLFDLAHVRGWFDDQYLAPAGGGDHPSALWGAILPHPRLGTMPATAFNQWQTSGFVWIPDQGTQAGPDLARYHSMLNFEVGWNAIAFCDPAAAGGNGCVQGVTVEQNCADRPLETGQELWYARIVSRTGAAKYYCVLRRVHPGASMPPVIGTARWRWIKHDEWVWEACGQGCCEVWRSET